MKKLQHFWLICCVSLLIALLIGNPISAHEADLAVAEILVGETQTQMTLSVPTNLVAIADDNQDNQLSTQEIQRHQGELEKLLHQRIQFTNHQGEEGKLSLETSDSSSFRGDSDSHTTLNLRYIWSEPVQSLTLNYNLFVPEETAAQCLATIVYQGKSKTVVLTPENSSFVITQEQPWQQSVSFFALGFEHILIGYDHILFLISLLLAGGGLGELLKIVTAFTAAHSLTLSLAVLGIVTLPASVVEIAIALSIIYVAAENLLRKETKQRWLLTFCFGLIHGLGFAGILQEANLSAASLTLSLASFNIGVEIGQILIVAIAFWLLKILSQRPWSRQLRNFASFLIVAVGMFWFIQRSLLLVAF